MLSVARREYLVLVLLGLIGLGFLAPSLHTARAEVRDGLRRQDITYLKHSLEQFYNEHEFYPLAPECLTSTATNEWDFIEVLPHDVKEADGFLYRYCVTSQNQLSATGYFLEAQLEVGQANTVAFDEDELRKFHYRILHAGNKILYRVCGGEEKQCESN
ncbi:MAG TPA: hypothetical protein VJC05_00385 [Candidatus Andersenbacteria bacterium]|nr:hypothetical protein [Candidatus Andersenbacteria bacterium]